MNYYTFRPGLSGNASMHSKRAAAFQCGATWEMRARPLSVPRLLVLERPGAGGFDPD
jgi:hypothetical protein